MAKSKKVHRYTGILNRPMPLPQPMNVLAINSPIDRERAEREYLLRLDALMRDCEVDPASPERMTDLAIVLATRHVPGFSFETGDGNAVRNAKQRRLMGIWSGMRKRLANGMSQRSAAELVAKQMNRRADGSKTLTADAVDRLYRRHKSSDE